MIWLKRISILLVLGAIVVGVFGYRHYQRQEYLRLAHENALITAQIWVATATYRDDPEQFMVFRDSMLTSGNVSREQLDKYLTMYTDEPERYLGFAQLVKKYVDSITAPLTGHIKRPLPPKAATDSVLTDSTR